MKRLHTSWHYIDGLGTYPKLYWQVLEIYNLRGRITLVCHTLNRWSVDEMTMNLMKMDVFHLFFNNFTVANVRLGR